MKLSLTQRVILTVLCFGIAMVGFMIKLPSVFRQHDTELHTLFYFLAAGFLNVLFVKRNLIGHILVFALLYAMGVAIEHAQEYSNSLVRQRIHGRYDPEDVTANLKGLVYFSGVWVVYVLLLHLKKGMGDKAIGGEKVNAVAPVADDKHQNISTSDRFADSDEAKLQEAIRLLTAVLNNNPRHPISLELEQTIRDLKKKIGS